MQELEIPIFTEKGHDRRRLKPSYDLKPGFFTLEPIMVRATPVVDGIRHR